MLVAWESRVNFLEGSWPNRLGAQEGGHSKGQKGLEVIITETRFRREGFS